MAGSKIGWQTETSLERLRCWATRCSMTKDRKDSGSWMNLVEGYLHAVVEHYYNRTELLTGAFKQ